jgi:hypothetical protein
MCNPVLDCKKMSRGVRWFIPTTHHHDLQIVYLLCFYNTLGHERYNNNAWSESQPVFTEGKKGKKIVLQYSVYKI